MSAEYEAINRFEVKHPTLDDVPEIRAMHAASWLVTYPNEGQGVPYEWVKETTDSWLTPEKLEKSREHFAEVFGDPNQLYRVAYEKDRIIGLVHVSKKPDDTFYLDALYINKDFYGQGLAQTLIQLANEWADGAPMTLEVAEYNGRAIRFYEKQGFHIVEGTRQLFKEKIPIVTMAREGSK